MSQSFNETVRQYHADYGRHDLPWRQSEADGHFDPYKILVSEMMLQQTQVKRVIAKFEEFLMKFPTVDALAAATLGEVITAWSGLGYNRRAKYVWQAAQAIKKTATFPSTIEDLSLLPGIGKNTAGAIMAYAFDKPAIFIETNIRTVYIHHFFTGQTDVPDSAIYEMLINTLDREQPREFYWALMDYGTHLKQTIGNASKYSSVYNKQSTFQGSRRQIRGQVLKLLQAGSLTATQLARDIEDDRLPAVLRELVNENLIIKADESYQL